MRIVLEILIVIGFGILTYSIVTSKNGRIERIEEENKVYKDHVETLSERLVYKQTQNDRLKQLNDQLEKNPIQKDKDLKEDAKEVERNYQEAIDRIESIGLDSLVGDAFKIGRKDSSLFVRLSELEFIQMRKNEIKIEKLETKFGICKERIVQKDALLKLRNLRIENYKKQIKLQKKKLNQKNDIIGNKDHQIKLLNKEIKRQKMQKIGIIGGVAIAIGGLFLIF